MKKIAESLYAADQALFLKIRLLSGIHFLEDHAVIFGNINAMMPFFVFLAITVYLAKPQSAVFSLFFTLAAFILSYQAASILANILMHPAPWKVEYYLHGAKLPALGNGAEISMPDWPVAAVVGSYYFVRMRLKLWQQPKVTVAWIPILLFALVRIYAGYAYPLGMLVAMLTGVLMGWLVFQLLRNLELLSPPPNPDLEHDSDGKGDSFEDSAD